jgi:hypothetical protein
MTRTVWRARMVTAISVITVVSGLAQVVRPAFVLALIGAETTPASQHFFAIVGMFMVLFGGALLHELASPARQPIVALWAGLQKLGASAAVGLGVAGAVFSPLALMVAGFDLLSGILIVWYWRDSRQSS